MTDRQEFVKAAMQTMTQVCHKCGDYVAPSTADAFKRISGRGEMYCDKCYEERKPMAKPKFKKNKIKRG